MTNDASTNTRVLASTAAFLGQPLRKALRLIAEAGFSGVEIMVTKDPASQDARRIRTLAGEYGLSVEAVHAPFLLLTRRVWGTDPIGKIYRSVELAESIEAPLTVVHPPYRWQPKYRRWLNERLPEFSSRTGVTVAVENMFPLRLPGEREMMFHASGAVDELERFDSVVLDTSHAAVAGHDIVEAYGRLGERLVHVHLSNNAGKGWDSHLPVDEGVLPIPDFLERLAGDGFDGAVSLELDLRNYLPDERATVEVLVRNREYCETRLGARK